MLGGVFCEREKVEIRGVGVVGEWWDGEDGVDEFEGVVGGLLGMYIKEFGVLVGELRGIW